MFSVVKSITGLPNRACQSTLLAAHLLFGGTPPTSPRPAPPLSWRCGGKLKCKTYVD
jgi:hypothetical protein